MSRIQDTEQVKEAMEVIYKWATDHKVNFLSVASFPMKEKGEIKIHMTYTVQGDDKTHHIVAMKDKPKKRYWKRVSDFLKTKAKERGVK